MAEPRPVGEAPEGPATIRARLEGRAPWPERPERLGEELDLAAREFAPPPVNPASRLPLHVVREAEYLPPGRRSWTGQLYRCAACGTDGPSKSVWHRYGCLLCPRCRTVAAGLRRGRKPRPAGDGLARLVKAQLRAPGETR